MSGTDIILWLGLVALLGSYFYIKHRRAVRSRSEPSDAAKWSGNSIDVTQIKPRVEDVRRNHLPAQQPAKGLCFHRALIELARQAVARLAYFHDRASEDHPQAHRP